MLDEDYALDVLQNHWATWITEDDFVAIKAAGLNHVRSVPPQTHPSLPAR